MGRGDRRPETADAPATAAPPVASTAPEAPAPAEQQRFDALAAEKLLLDAALAEAHEQLERLRSRLASEAEQFRRAWEDREAQFRNELNALFAEPAPAPKPPSASKRKAAATFTLLRDGARVTFRAGDALPADADLSHLPAWAYEDA